MADEKTLDEILEEDKDFNESDYVYLYYGNIKHPFQPMGVNALYTKHLHDFYVIQKSRAEKKLGKDSLGADVKKLIKDFETIDRNKDPGETFFGDIRNGITFTSSDDDHPGLQTKGFSIDDLEDAVSRLNQEVRDTADGVADYFALTNSICDRYLNKTYGMFTSLEWHLLKQAVAQNGKDLTEEQKEAVNLFFPGAMSSGDGKTISINMSEMGKMIDSLESGINKINDSLGELKNLVQKIGKAKKNNINCEVEIGELRKIHGTNKGVLNSFKGKLGEFSVARGLANANYEGLKAVSEIMITTSGSSQDKITSYSEDKAIMAMQKNYSPKSESVTSKSDVVVTVKAEDGSVTGEIGISVKDYKGYRKVRKGSAPTDLKNITLLSTNVFYLLANYIGYKRSQIFQILNVFAALVTQSRFAGAKEIELKDRGKTTSRADKEAAFDEIVTELAAASLLSALTGIQRGVKTDGTYSSFMVVGDRLLSIPDIIEQCIKDVTTNSSTKDPVSLLGLKSSLTRGLRYESINKANFMQAQPGPSNPIMAAAKERSRRVSSLGIQSMRQHSIKITLSSRIIVALLQNITPKV